MALSPFVSRHIGPRESEIQRMLDVLGYHSLDDLTTTVVPPAIADNEQLDMELGVSEEVALAELRALVSENIVLKSMIGQGYYGTHTPKVIQRNVLENPAWYTAYTPYQPEISQGRLEVLFYFQTMICRADRAGNRQRVVAGRSHRRGRSDDACAIATSKATAIAFWFRRFAIRKRSKSCETRADPIGNRGRAVR